MSVPKVALLIETSNAYARGLLQGVVAYLREHRPWSVYLAEHGRGDAPPGWLARWRGDGVIARIENRSIAQALAGLKIPIVDVSAARLLPKLPWFETDDEAIARMAAQHFLERGFKQFGFCGDGRFNWSNWRGNHFEAVLRADGRSLFRYEPTGSAELAEEAELDGIANWVVKLPKPIGIFACYDFRGRQVLDACRQRKVAVPDEVAVLGVDNDEVLCSLADPPLSSVIPNTHRTGYAAAQLLDQLMRSQARPSPESHFIEPIGIATRRSTDALAIEDANLVRAIRFIREHACDGLSVKEVLRHVPQSRRLFEARFKQLVGRTPHEEILRVQLDRARLLLAETGLTLAQIAERAGFSHVEYFSAVFKKKTGLPPSRFRMLNHQRRPFASHTPSR